MPSDFLPYGRHLIEEDDIAAVAQVLRGDWLTTGPAVEKFEADLQARLGVRHVVSCANGTAALHMAAFGVELGPGDVAVVPSMTFLATANAARYVGAEVAFADVDPDSGIMGARHLQDAIERARRLPGSGRIRAVFPVHLNGQIADIKAIRSIADAHDIKVVTDASHALGTAMDNPTARSMVGDCRWEDATTFSFHPVKTIAMGEGGAVTTNSDATAALLRRFRNHGMTREAADFVQRKDAFDEDGNPNPWYYEMPDVGYNYRASDIHCALASSQLSKLERFAERRRALAARYDALLDNMLPVVRPIHRVAGCRPVWHLYVVLVDFQSLGRSRATVMAHLRARGIGTQVHYFPVHRQPYYQNRYGELTLPGAEAYYRRALSLPLFPAMTDVDVERVVSALRDVLAP